MTDTEGRKGRVFQRGESWSYTVDVAPAGAPRKQVARGGFRTRRLAQSALTTVLHDLGRATYVPVDRKVTFASYLEAVYLPGAKVEGLRPSTIESYERIMRLHVVPVLGPIPLASIDAAMLDRLWAALIAKGLSARSVRYIATTTGTVFKLAVRQGVLAVSPMAKSSPPSAKSAKPPTMRTWTGAEAGAFITATAGEREGPLWRLLIASGCRRGEVLGLRWAEVDLSVGTITIRRSLGQVGVQVVEGEPKTAAGARTLQIDDATVMSLRAHRAAMNAERLMLGEGFTDGGWVFAKPDGQHLTPRNVTMAFGRRVKRATLPQIRLHDLRHTWATLALQAGVSPKVVAERLGHSNVSITLGTYTHTDAALHRGAADAVASLFGPAVSIS